jgi:hypothetical protein
VSWCQPWHSHSRADKRRRRRPSEDGISCDVPPSMRSIQDKNPAFSRRRFDCPHGRRHGNRVSIASSPVQGRGGCPAIRRTKIFARPCLIRPRRGCPDGSVLRSPRSANGSWMKDLKYGLFDLRPIVQRSLRLRVLGPVLGHLVDLPAITVEPMVGTPSGHRPCGLSAICRSPRCPDDGNIALERISTWRP